VCTVPGVVAVSPTVTGSAVVVRGDATRVVLLTGMDPELHYDILPLPEKIVRGTARATGTDILIGTDLASDLGMDVGDKLRVTGAGGVTTTLTIAGIFDLGNKRGNARSTFMALRTAQALMTCRVVSRTSMSPWMICMPPRPLPNGSPVRRAYRRKVGSARTRNCSAP